MTPEQALRTLALDPAITAGWIARLAEPHRHYHTLDHIAQMLAHAGSAPSRELLAAIWLHDIVYDPRAADNEERSAALAGRDLAASDLDVATVQDLIIATKHHIFAPAQSSGAALIVDLDLLILGEPPAGYDCYAAAIRREYAHVAEAAYRPARAQLLERFLAAPMLYRTAAFRDREPAARANLRREIAALRAR